MNLPNRRFLTFIGAGLALVAGLGLAWVLLVRTPASSAPPPAAEGGLVVQAGRDDDLKLDPKRPLRCFVGGQFVGELPLEVCAQRNGVATGALDVGLDQSGALAATNGAGVPITPLAQPRASGAPEAIGSNAIESNATASPTAPAPDAQTGAAEPNPG